METDIDQDKCEFKEYCPHETGLCGEGPYVNCEVRGGILDEFRLAELEEKNRVDGFEEESVFIIRSPVFELEGAGHAIENGEAVPVNYTEELPGFHGMNRTHCEGNYQFKQQKGTRRPVSSSGCHRSKFFKKGLEVIEK